MGIGGRIPPLLEALASPDVAASGLGLTFLSCARFPKFPTLSAESKLDPERIHDFTLRLTQHIRTHRLKGVDPFIWYVEALERLANDMRG